MYSVEKLIDFLKSRKFPLKPTVLSWHIYNGNCIISIPKDMQLEDNNLTKILCKFGISLYEYKQEI